MGEEVGNQSNIKNLVDCQKWIHCDHFGLYLTLSLHWLQFKAAIMSSTAPPSFEIQHGVYTALTFIWGLTVQTPQVCECPIQLHSLTYVMKYTVYPAAHNKSKNSNSIRWLQCDRHWAFATTKKKKIYNENKVSSSLFFFLVWFSLLSFQVIKIWFQNSTIVWPAAVN